MDAREYQRAASRTARRINEPIDADAAGLLRSAVGLCGETGELLDEVKKIVFHDHEPDRVRLKKELGDVAWYLAQVCTDLGIELADVMQANIEKLRTRYPDGFTAAASVRRVDVEEVKA